MDQLDLKKNQDLEVSIVGCLLNDSSYIENEWVAKLSPSDFMYEYERTVFITIKELEKSQQVIDLTTVINRLKEKGKLEKDDTPTFFNLDVKKQKKGQVF